MIDFEVKLVDFGTFFGYFTLKHLENDKKFLIGTFSEEEIDNLIEKIKIKKEKLKELKIKYGYV